MSPNTSAEDVRGVPTAWFWIATFLIVAVFGYGLTPWDAIGQLLESRGVGKDQSAMLAFAAGYTLPLTAGFAVLSWAVLSGAASQLHPWYACIGAAFVLWASGEAARSLGLGLLPEYAYIPTSGPAPVQLLERVLYGYFNSYGWPLMLSALGLGFSTAISIVRLTEHDV